MKTYPEIRVWHNNSPSKPVGENYWKHGYMREVPDVDGYILISKGLENWCASMSRYGMSTLDSVWWKFVHRGWYGEASLFQLDLDDKGIQHFYFSPTTGNMLETHFKFLLEEISEAYELEKRIFIIPHRKLWRNGDATPLDNYLTNEDQ
jgi:hypothetical protein